MWQKALSKTTAIVTALCCCMGLSSCLLPPDYDQINHRVDPDIEVRKAFNQTPEAYRTLAYYVLTEVRKKPGIREYVGTLDPLHERWIMADGNTKPRSVPFAAAVYPAMAGVYGADGPEVTWMRELPDMVFFVFYCEEREDTHGPLVRFYRDSKSKGKRAEVAVLAYHPGQPAPTKFRLDRAATDRMWKQFKEKQKTDPNAVLKPWDWDHEPLRPNWSLLYPR